MPSYNDLYLWIRVKIDAAKGNKEGKVIPNNIKEIAYYENTFKTCKKHIFELKNKEIPKEVSESMFSLRRKDTFMLEGINGETVVLSFERVVSNENLDLMTRDSLPTDKSEAIAFCS